LEVGNSQEEKIRKERRVLEDLLRKKLNALLRMGEFNRAKRLLEAVRKAILEI